MGIVFIGPDFVGLDAKILRPYKQMIRSYNITLVLSIMDSNTSGTLHFYLQIPPRLQPLGIGIAEHGIH
jgi:hypothetical protein